MGNLFSWTDGLSVGVPELDEQNRLLIGLLNRLHVAVDTRQGSRACGDILGLFVAHARTQFEVEERLMRRLGYPEFDSHRGHHQQFMNQLVAVQARMARDGVSMSFELLHFLKVWLARHIRECDRGFGEFAVEREQAPAWSPAIVRATKRRVGS